MQDNPNSAEALFAQDRLAAVERLFLENQSFIRELIYSDPHSNADTENQIFAGIAEHLPSYDAAPTDSAFQAWLTEVLVPLVGFYAIRRVCEPFVRAAIWRGLGHSTEPSKFDDYPELVRELEQEVWLWVFLHLKELKERGQARITTRVYARASIVTRDWLKRQRTRRAAVIRRMYNLPRKSKANDAEMLAAELDREAAKAMQQRAEAEEIQEEMKKVGLLV